MARNLLVGITGDLWLSGFPFRGFNAEVIRFRFVLLAVSTWFAAWAEARASLSGVDSGFSARELIRRTDAEVLERWGRTGPWIRIRRLPDPSDPKRAAEVEPEREALGRLRAMGFKPVPFIRWAPASWANGVRAESGHRLPLDLREAFRRSKRIAETYGTVVAGFEFENEPDINFVDENAETYAAFQKACYLGVRAADVRPAVDWLRTITGVGGGVAVPVVKAGRKPLAIMAPLALPPGPFFERIRENGLFGYTDAFNYHFYGHAEDFSRVYRQFEDAVGASGNAGKFKVERPKTEGAESKGKRRRLPVMLTEHGFSGVSGPERHGAEVRVDQWRWFRSVGEQIKELRIGAPMAFYLPPYYERKLIEFGMTVRPADEEERRDDGTKQGAAALRAGGLAFRPEDFGVQRVEPWMERIGARVGGNEALPALAWLWDAAERNRYRPRDWEIEAPEPSPIVIDVVAGVGLVQLKRYNGYMIANPEKDGGAARGAGELVIYNFSDRPIRGRLRWEGEGGTRIAWTTNDVLTVGAMERATVPFEATSQSDVFAGGKLKIRFEPDAPEIGPALLVTQVYPTTAGMSAEIVERFDHSVEATAQNRELLLARPRASDERKFSPAGRWLTTAYARVEESANGRWRLVGTDFRRGPKEGRATFELPLRDTFTFPDQAALRLSYRLAEATGLDAGEEERVFLEVYIRTENGNLFVVWPWLSATSQWGSYLELKTNFTMMFQSRANLPWRFAENRPVSLVFSFYSPTMDGAAIEIHGAEIVRIKR